MSAQNPARKARKENGMRNCNATEKQTTRRILPIACAMALVVAFTVSLPQPAYARQVTPPPVPTDIQVPAGFKAFLEGHGVGTQNYICLPSDSGFAWTLFTPEATLFNDRDKQVITHFFGPNPDEHGTVRAEWQHSRDTSAVWAQLFRPPYSEPDFVAPGAIPWLVLEVDGKQDGPTGGDTLTGTRYIQRLNTSGGIAPSDGCSGLTDVGKKAFVPYEADYFFFAAPECDADDND